MTSEQIPAQASTKRTDQAATTRIQGQRWCTTRINGKRFPGVVISLGAALALGLAAAGCGGATAPTTTAGAAGGAVAVKVTIPGDYYSPLVATVGAGQTVKFVNQDNKAQTVTSVPGDAQTFNLPLAAGASGQVRFAQPGVYPYYSTMAAHLGSATNKKGVTLKNVVLAKRGTGVYPAPMLGYIVVQGVGTGVPTTTTVAVPHDFFTPAVTVIQAGGTVTWKNADSGSHTVDSVPGAAKRFDVVLAPGGSSQITFAQPGAYLYYCNVHTVYDAKHGVFKALKNSGFYPYAMAGLVVVQPRG